MAFTYRPDDEIQARLDEIKKQEEIKANSKALDYIISLHLNLKSKVNNQEKKIRELETELYEIKSILKQKNHADLKLQKLIESF